MIEHTETLTRFFKALAQPERLRIMGLLATRPHTVVELAKALAQKETVVIRHLAQLQETDLIQAQTAEVLPRYQLDVKALAQMNKTLLQPNGEARAQQPQTLAERVYRHYLNNERIKEIPANDEALLVILNWLAARFETGQQYPEKVVNEIIQRHYDDYATLRRYLVDYGLMQRAAGVYWRKETAT